MSWAPGMCNLIESPIFSEWPFQGKRMFLLFMVNFSRLHYNLACNTRRKRNCERVRKIRSFSPPLPPSRSPLPITPQFFVHPRRSFARPLARSLVWSLRLKKERKRLLRRLCKWQKLTKAMVASFPTAGQGEQRLWCYVNHARIACLLGCLVVSSHANYVLTNFNDLCGLWKKYFDESTEYTQKGM